MRRNVFLGVLALLLLAGPGCVTHAANRVTIVPEGTPEIRVVNGGLQDECEILTARGLYEGEILTGVVELESHVDRKLELEGRFMWFDADGIQQEGGRAWEILFVNAMEQKQVQGKAPEPGAVGGHFELRRYTGRTDGDR